MIRDDSWDLIPDTPSNQLLQPTPKSCPLRRPEFDLRPRFPAAMHVSARTPMCDTRFQCSGPRLTLAGIPTAAPTVVPGLDRISVPALCPSTADALPRPPLNKGTREKADMPYPSVRPSHSLRSYWRCLGTHQRFTVHWFLLHLLMTIGNVF